MRRVRADDSPHAERFESGIYHPQPVSAYTISGARDGATTDATGVFTLANGDRLIVELHVAYNPTPVLAGGHWSQEGATPEEGDVREESLKFLGGRARRRAWEEDLCWRRTARRAGASSCRCSR